MEPVMGMYEIEKTEGGLQLPEEHRGWLAEGAEEDVVVWVLPGAKGLHLYPASIPGDPALAAAKRCRLTKEGELRLPPGLLDRIRWNPLRSVGMFTHCAISQVPEEDGSSRSLQQAAKALGFDV